jgi:PhzF family phenazine biosynthesis protein
MRYFVVDAFAEEVFKGNPAGVCLLDEWLDDQTLQRIAIENNLSETAFIVPRHDRYELRWFTPEKEIDLCGHATLASAFVLARFVHPERTTLRFDTMSGELTVERQGDLFVMDFPARLPVPIPVTRQMEEAIGVPVREAHRARDLLLLVDSEEQVRNLRPDLVQVAQLSDCFALVVTAKGDDADFVSRFFIPGSIIPEDPVTGSSHSTLIPFWADRLNKQKMTAKQLSKRGGTLYCEACGERVKIAGAAILYLKGEIYLE